LDVSTIRAFEQTKTKEKKKKFLLQAGKKNLPLIFFFLSLSCVNFFVVSFPKQSK